MQCPHRHNSDGSFDSICPNCAITIATATNEADLRRVEAAHECDPAREAYYKSMSHGPKRFDDNASSQQVESF